MSKALRPNVLRAVRLLPEAVRIGNAPSGSEDPPERPSSDLSAPDHPGDLLTQLTDELSLLKKKLEETEKENKTLLSRAERFESELSAEKKRLEKDRIEMTDKLEAEALAARGQATSEGFEEGRKTGYEQGIDDARKEAAREAREKIQSMVALLGAVYDSLKEKVDDLADLQMPRLIRMWEFLLSRMLCREAALDEGTARRVLAGVLERISDKDRVFVYLNPEDLEGVQAKKDEFGELLRGVKHLEFTPDRNVDVGSCIVETNLGIYDARWRTQLEQIAAEIDRLFIEGGAEDDGSS